MPTVQKEYILQHINYKDSKPLLQTSCTKKCHCKKLQLCSTVKMAGTATPSSEHQYLNACPNKNIKVHNKYTCQDNHIASRFTKFWQRCIISKFCTLHVHCSTTGVTTCCFKMVQLLETIGEKPRVMLFSNVSSRI